MVAVVIECGLQSSSSTNPSASASGNVQPTSRRSSNVRSSGAFTLWVRSGLIAGSINRLREAIRSKWEIDDPDYRKRRVDARTAERIGAGADGQVGLDHGVHAGSKLSDDGQARRRLANPVLVEPKGGVSGLKWDDCGAGRYLVTVEVSRLPGGNNMP